MGLEKFTRDDPIFHDENVLRDSYRPDDLIERDAELTDYQGALKPVIKGARPKNIFVYGQTGVGKSLSTNMILDRLLTDQEEFDNLDIHVVTVVCKTLTSSYQVSIRLVNDFRQPGEMVSNRGHAPGDIYDMLWEHLNTIDATHVLFVLDEIDAIGTDDDLLYELPRCNDNGNVEGTNVGVIGISNDFTFRDDLSGRVKDSLCEEEIHFPPYDATQLGNILAQRADKAFIEGVLEGDVVPLCAAFAGQETGSARHALKLLYKAGDLARSRDDPPVTEADVRQAERLIEEGRIKDELEQLPTQSHVTLSAVLQLSEAGETPAKRKRIYEVYTTAAERIDVDVKTDRTIHDRLSQLDLKGFVELEAKNEGLRGGSYYQYELSVQPDLVRDVLRNTPRIAELYQ
jgi:cell division control protein 6